MKQLVLALLVLTSTVAFAEKEDDKSKPVQADKNDILFLQNSFLREENANLRKEISRLEREIIEMVLRQKYKMAEGDEMKPDGSITRAKTPPAKPQATEKPPAKK